MNAFPKQIPPGPAFVLREAIKRGYTPGNPSWCNLGQGQPQTGPIPGAPSRSRTAPCEESDYAYGPVAGTSELRQAIADHYNRLYRQGRRSLYSAENVAVSGGGRLALSRAINALGIIRLGFQTPDYMSFEQLIAHNLHKLQAVAVPTDPCEGFRLEVARLLEVIRSCELDAFLFSNPCNPTGQLLEEDELCRCVDGARRQRFTLLVDEFYSHYVYQADGSPAGTPVSAARYVNDVNTDPVVIVDGLTKNFRRPGWRVGWTIAPIDIIEQIVLSGTAIDGGASTVVQRMALDVLAAPAADQETRAVRSEFARKRAVMVAGLRKCGIRVPAEPRGTFYAWVDVSGLPPPLSDADAFFEAALDRKVITVPGRHFALNPHGRRPPEDRTLGAWARLSFGPEEACLREALGRLAEMTAGFSGVRPSEAWQ